MSVPLPDSPNVVELADWAESVLLAEDVSQLSKAEMRTRLGPMGTPEESQLEMVLSEVRRRASLGPGVYPFRVNRSVVERIPEVDPAVYGVLLFLSLSYADFRERKVWNPANRVMDRLARDALQAYLGDGSEAVVFAWPVSDGRPEDFFEAVTWLADRLDLEVGRGPANPRKKDGGVDVVAWKRFRDGRSTYLVVLAQCTFRADFGGKAKDITLNQWRSWIVFGSGPSVVLVVPHVIGVNDPVWDDVRFDAQVLIDRGRLMELLADVTLTAEEAAELRSWLATEMAALAS